MSYAHEDEDMKDELKKFLKNLTRSEQIEIWQDREIIAGEEWDEVINKELNTADLILLLVSADFNNSDFIWTNELATAMERHEKREAKVIPIMLRTCDWADMPYAKLQALPKNANPVTNYPNRDEAFTEIAKGIRRVVELMSNS